jgi:hypothetical protein
VIEAKRRLGTVGVSQESAFLELDFKLTVRTEYERLALEPAHWLHVVHFTRRLRCQPSPLDENRAIAIESPLTVLFLPLVSMRLRICMGERGRCEGAFSRMPGVLWRCVLFRRVIPRVGLGQCLLVVLCIQAHQVLIVENLH